MIELVGLPNNINGEELENAGIKTFQVAGINIGRRNFHFDLVYFISSLVYFFEVSDTRNRKHLLKPVSDEDQTIELSDDEDEAQIFHVNAEDVTNNDERIVEPEETKSEIRTRPGRISKRPNRLKDYETF